MARLPLFDAHCHLQDARIAGRAPELIRQASQAGVRWFAVNGTSEEDWGAVKTMGEAHECVIPNFGLHPWWIPKRSERWLHNLREALQAVPSAAVGEVGLDLGTRGREIDEALQLDVLREQLELGRELRRPVSVHCVRAIGPMQALISRMGTFPAGFIMHSFNGPAESVRSLAKCGAYFSFSGFFTQVKASKAGNILKQVPLDRILLETDAPDALPKVDLQSLVWVPEDASAPHHFADDENSSHSEEQRTAYGALNHPSNIQANLSHVASLMRISEEQLSSCTMENAKRVFSFPGSKLQL